MCSTAAACRLWRLYGCHTWIPYLNVPEKRWTICCLPLSSLKRGRHLDDDNRKILARRSASCFSFAATVAIRSHHHFYDRYRKLPLLLLILCFLSGFLFLAKCKRKRKITTRIMYNNWRCIFDDTKEDQSSVTGTQSMYVLSKIQKRKRKGRWICK